MKKLFVFFVFVFAAFQLSAKCGKICRIWKDIPGMEKQYSVMYVHDEVKKDGTLHPAVIILPGGSYHHLGLYNEGYKTAEWFVKKGFAAFTLKYRTAENGHHYPAMLEDVQRAVLLVRENAGQYGVDVNKVGVIGFSAGGHLALMAASFYESHDELLKLGIKHEFSLRPDFCIPVYPVVSMNDELAHRWSRKSLLGKDQSPERKNEFSMELNVNDNMPPVYVVVCRDDPVVDYRNSFVLADALKAKNIPGGFAVYEWGKHGFGMLDNKFMKEFNWNEKMWDEFLSKILY